MLTIIGLGNPGTCYRYTRHNAGFMALDKIVNGTSVQETRFGRGKEAFLHPESSGSTRNLLELEGELGGTRFVLVKPLTYMNESGRAVTSLRTRGVFKDLEELLVVSDDFDLEVGRVRLRERGSAGGHNGLQSIISALGTEEFTRVRIGVGPRPTGAEMVEYVLGSFAPDERNLLEPALARGARAVTAWVDGDVAEALRELERNRQPQE